jgi:gas vesicle protein
VAKSSSGFGYFAVAVGAAAIGGLIGVLAAPAPGRETRKKWGKRIEKETEQLKKKGRRAMQDWGEAASEQFAESKKQLTQLLHS